MLGGVKKSRILIKAKTAKGSRESRDRRHQVSLSQYSGLSFPAPVKQKRQQSPGCGSRGEHGALCLVGSSEFFWAPALLSKQSLWRLLGQQQDCM